MEFSPEDVAYVQDKIYEWQSAVEDYWQANKAALLSQTLSITASVAGVVANLVMGFVFAVYILLEKKQLAVSSRRALYAFAVLNAPGTLLRRHRLPKGFVPGLSAGSFWRLFTGADVFCRYDNFRHTLCFCYFRTGCVPCGCAVYRLHNQCSYRLHIYSNIAAGKVIVLLSFSLYCSVSKAIFSIRELSANPLACRSCGCLLRL